MIIRFSPNGIFIIPFIYNIGNMKKNYIWIVLVLVIIGLVLYFSNKPSNTLVDANPIKIGAVISLTGPAAVMGEYSKKGMDLAVSEINNKGGMEGRRVEIIYEDDKTDPKSAVSAYNKLISVSNVNGVIGGMYDFMAQPLLPLALANKIAFISPPQFRIEGGFDLNDQSFVMLTDFNKVIRGLQDYLKRDDVKTIAVVHFKSTFGTEIAKTINQVSIEIGKGSIIDEPYTGFGTNDYRTTIAKLKQAKADTVFLDMVDIDTVTFLTQAKSLNFSPKFITYVGSYDAFKDDNKSLLEGIVVLNWESSAPEFIKSYRKAYNTDPAKSANHAYDAVYVMAEAIAKTKTNADVANYISSNKFKTINGEIQFLGTHEVSSTPVEIDIYKGGSLVPLN
jgi:branched-chain amino acid transport system substrate-binding protein